MYSSDKLPLILRIINTAQRLSPGIVVVVVVVPVTPDTATLGTIIRGILLAICTFCHKTDSVKALLTYGTSNAPDRSATRGDLQVLACRTSSFGPCSFAACAPKLWNSLPPSLRDPTLTLTLFCSRLKTHLFGLAYGRTLVTA